jgi:RNA polymerase sigma factor for flagellar operon FliA
VLSGKKELRTVLSKAMKNLPQRYQDVIGLYYVGDKTMRQIGEKLGINESRVCQIHRAALEKMSTNLRAAGIHSSECLM